jgi:hypothetical protein
MNTALSGAALAAACAIALGFAPIALADDCPSTATTKGSFVVERGPDSKTEVFSGNGPIVRSVLRYRGQTVLETTQHEGIFELDRLDRGRRFVLKPKTDLAKFFPLKEKQKIDAEFDLQQDDGKLTTSRAHLNVIGIDTLYIGPCKYDILKIEREETRAGARFFSNVDYYAPALKYIVAKEYRERDGRTKLIKFDKIYTSTATR